MTASRRLQLAAEGSGAIGLALRRRRRQAQAAEFSQPTAAMTRWRVSVLPSTPLPVPGVGRARWRLELLRCRRGESAEFEVEACGARGRLALSQVKSEKLSPRVLTRRQAASLQMMKPLKSNVESCLETEVWRRKQMVLPMKRAQLSNL
jgi:protein ImuA